MGDSPVPRSVAIRQHVRASQESGRHSLSQFNLASRIKVRSVVDRDQTFSGGEENVGVGVGDRQLPCTNAVAMAVVVNLADDESEFGRAQVLADSPDELCEQFLVFP